MGCCANATVSSVSVVTRNQNTDKALIINTYLI